MAYAIGDAIDGPVPCDGCDQVVDAIFAEGMNYAGRMNWRCAACYAPAVQQQAAELDKPPPSVVDCRQSKSAQKGRHTGGANMAKQMEITYTRGKATKNGYRYDSTSAQVRGSIYLNAADSKNVTLLEVTIKPGKTS
tara:strand:- start:225 stop:635 length:411 start_codon:yes stop_codon:yes gene_type:complete